MVLISSEVVVLKSVMPLETVVALEPVMPLEAMMVLESVVSSKLVMALEVVPSSRVMATVSFCQNKVALARWISLHHMSHTGATMHLTGCDNLRGPHIRSGWLTLRCQRQHRYGEKK
jgi:hypothetical protein